MIITILIGVIYMLTTMSRDLYTIIHLLRGHIKIQFNDLPQKLFSSSRKRINERKKKNKIKSIKNKIAQKPFCNL